MFFTSLRRKTHQTAAPRGRLFVPRLENLEERTVPSTLTVVNPNDTGAGSLRNAITHANSRVPPVAIMPKAAKDAAHPGILSSARASLPGNWRGRPAGRGDR